MDAKAKFDVILADPPWNFKTYTKKGQGKSPSQHYDIMSIEDLKSLPVEKLAATNAMLALWTTDTHLLQAMELGQTWGFTYKTVLFTWVKTTRDGTRYPIGTGYYTRANPEMCLLFRRGNKALERYDRGVPQLIMAPRSKHSEKPIETHKRIERLWGPEIKKIELFARETRPGWTCIGNGIDGKDIRVALSELK